MSFDYFYGPDDAEQYSFYRIPKRLIPGDEFQETSTEAKLLYGLMLDRLQLSIRNQWLDALNRVYIIYTAEDIMADLHWDNQKACKLLSELENKTGLIKRKRQGLGKPSLIYILKFSTSCPQNDLESHFKTCENHTSVDVKTTSLDMWKSHGNNTDFNKPEYNKTNPIYPGKASAKITVSVDGMGRDEMDERRSYERYFRDHLYIDDLKQSYSCTNRDCRFALWKDNRFLQSIGKNLTRDLAVKLISGEKVKLKKCVSRKSGRTFDAVVSMTADADGKQTSLWSFCRKAAGNEEKPLYAL